MCRSGGGQTTTRSAYNGREYRARINCIYSLCTNTKSAIVRSGAAVSATLIVLLLLLLIIRGATRCTPAVRRDSVPQLPH